MIGQANFFVQFFEGSSKRFIIPVYQRNYDWKKENCKQLYDDLVSVIRNNKNTHFFGSIVSSTHHDDKIIIDGQQRITTISLIFIAMVNALKKGVLTSEKENRRQQIENTYIVDEYSDRERKVKLKPYRDDCEAFDRLIYNDETEYIEQSNITVNYEYFYDRLTTQKELTIDELFEAIKRLQIINIQLEPEHGDEPQLIFESLNSTGLDLTESDKVRNYILMGLDASTQEKFYNDYWDKIEKDTNKELDAFIRNYLSIKTGNIPNQRKIYAEFKSYMTDGKKVEPVLQDMLRYANHFRKFKEGNVESAEVNRIVERLELLEMSVMYPFVLPFYDYYLENNLPESELKAVLSCVETYIFRRQMCQLLTAALNKIFLSLHTSVIRLLSKYPNELYSSVLIYILTSKKLTVRFPQDEEFRQAFVTRNIYEMKSKNKFYLFERLENGDSRETHDVVKMLTDHVYSVEHIMPQTLNTEWKEALGSEHNRIFDEWLHTIANLTITGYNSEYSNQSFERKKTCKNGFIDSGLRLNQYICKFDKWTEEELKARRNHLTELALKVWTFPITNFVPQETPEEIVNIADEFDYRNRDLTKLFFMDTAIEVKSWADGLVKICKELFYMDPAIMHALAEDEEEVYFADKPLKNTYKKIATSLYVNTLSDTYNKVKNMKKLLKAYSLDEDEISFCLAPQKEEKE